MPPAFLLLKIKGVFSRLPTGAYKNGHTGAGSAGVGSAKASEVEFSVWTRPQQNLLSVRSSPREGAIKKTDGGALLSSLFPLH